MGETELARMVVRLTGESVGYQKMLVEAQQQTESSMKKMEATVKGAGIVAAIMMIKGKFDEYKDSIKAFFHEGFAAYSEAEEVLINLQAMLKANERDVDALTTRYQDFANAQISLLAVSDEQILGNLRMAESFGLTADAAERAVLHATGLARVAGSSTDSMMRLVAAMEKGDTKRAMMFARMVPQLRGIRDETEFIAKFNKLWAAGLEAAQKSAETAAGRIKVMKEEWGNFMEEVGGVIAPIVLPFIESTRKGIASLQAFMKPVFEWLKESWKSASETAAMAWDYIKTKAQEFWEWIRPVARQTWNILVAGWELVKTVASAVWEWIKGVAMATAEGISRAWRNFIGEWRVDWTGIKDFVIDMLIAMEFILRNFKDTVSLVWDTARLKFHQWAGEVEHWFQSQLPNLGESLSAAFEGNWEQSIEALTRQAGPRIIGAFERDLQTSVARQNARLQYNFAEFRERRLRELNATGEEIRAAETAGQQQEEARNKGAFKEMAKFDAAVRSSAEARSRIEAYQNRLSSGTAGDSRAAAVAAGNVEARVREGNQIQRQIEQNTRRMAQQPQIVVEDADLA